MNAPDPKPESDQLSDEQLAAVAGGTSSKSQETLQQEVVEKFASLGIPYEPDKKVEMRTLMKKFFGS